MKPWSGGLGHSNAKIARRALQFPPQRRTVLEGEQCEIGGAQFENERGILEAYKRGWSRAEKKVVIGDGAEWIWNIADQHFPGAIQIVDLYHARQHLWELARKLFPNQQAEQERWMIIHKDVLLGEGKIEELVASLRSINPSNPELVEKDPHRG